jgi:hypothetical protein
VTPLPIDDSDQGVVLQDPECPLFIPPLEEAQAEEEDPSDHEEGYPWDEEEEETATKRNSIGRALYESPIKFMEAFTTTVDGNQYDIRYIL